MLGLYIHIPFCKKKCFYCDFLSINYDDVLTDEYISTIIKESQQYKYNSISTIYIGGGTPSVLSLKQLEKLIKHIKLIFDISNLQEFTVELNPESTTIEKLKLLYDENITRLSFGLQSINDNILQHLGRLHNFNKFQEVYNNAIRIGFDNINIDLMYGIQNQTLNDWEKTIDTVLKFNSNHISLYPLTIEQGTKFYQQNIKVDTDLQRQMYEIACNMFKINKFKHYEISNWAKEDKYSKHNKMYWQNKEYIGLGASSASYYKRYRFKNTLSISEYIANITQDKSSIIEKEYINDTIYNTETIMLGLRLSEGV
ncbi:MAG: radical SAM family heme chaperone HemW, partial [Endomicrobiia bacterium]